MWLPKIAIITTQEREYNTVWRVVLPYRVIIILPKIMWITWNKLRYCFMISSIQYHYIWFYTPIFFCEEVHIHHQQSSLLKVLRFCSREQYAIGDRDPELDVNSNYFFLKFYNASKISHMLSNRDNAFILLAFLSFKVKHLWRKKSIATLLGKVWVY